VPWVLPSPAQGALVVVEAVGADLLGNGGNGSQGDSSVPVLRGVFLVDRQAVPLLALQTLAAQASAVEAALSPAECLPASRVLLGTLLLAGGCLALTLVALGTTLLTMSRGDVQAVEKQYQQAMQHVPHQENALLQALELIHMSDMSARPDQPGFGEGGGEESATENFALLHELGFLRSEEQGGRRRSAAWESRDLDEEGGSQASGPASGPESSDGEDGEGGDGAYI
jgi:hypothetical protein